MEIIARIAALSLLALGAPILHAADAPVLSTAKELKWVDVAEPAGGQQALLWGDPIASESGVLARWKFNSKTRPTVRSQDLHVVILAGTFTVEIDGNYREFGPGGFVGIPRDVKHTLGCEAAGECRLVMHHGAQSR